MWFQGPGERCLEAPVRERGVGAPGVGHSPRGKDSGSSSDLDLKAETVEALAVRQLARAGAVTERAAARAAGGPTSFRGLGAAGIQAVGWAGQREVTGFCTGPAIVLGPRGPLLPAGGAAVGTAALGQQAVPSQQHDAEQQQIDAHSDEHDGRDGEQQGRTADGSRGWIPRARGGLDKHRRKR